MAENPYETRAREFADRWESVRFEQVHASWMDLLPPNGGIALDIGAGSGRDAAWLVGRGFEVMAVEPSSALREEARRRHPSPRIRWIADSMPDLGEVYRIDYRYDLILLSAVWMHMRPAQRERAFRKISNLLKPGGLMVVTLRQGPRDPDRSLYPVDPSELEHLGRKRALLTVPLPQPVQEDTLGRRDIRWMTTVLRLPDDGTGALPLLRHIIVNDRKTATYKLALLRVLIRIADGSRGMVIERDAEFVTLPFGLVALYWARSFKPLVFPARPPSYPQNRNLTLDLGFVKEGFKRLAEVAPGDLTVGGRFEGADAAALVRALNDICRTIQKMPAFYTTLPGSDRQVFEAHRRPVRIPPGHSLRLDRLLLEAFGTFRVPSHLWDAMSRYACWIEPAVLDAWCDLMRTFDSARKVTRSLDQYRKALAWLDPDRDTRLVRDRIEELRGRNQRIFCVWSGKRLVHEFTVDHCLPFAVWPNNDLWNLMPASPAINLKKSDRLPSATLFHKASDRMMTWWERAYSSYALFDRYRDEAFSSLPYAALQVSRLSQGTPPGREAVLRAVLAGVENQRTRLKADQQVEEWEG